MSAMNLFAPTSPAEISIVSMDMHWLGRDGIPMSILAVAKVTGVN
ncbi:hypothetical protein SGPA1_41273 [Streptomyces misionensis JCM 4497]